MIKLKHTPGPWKASVNNNGNIWIHSDNVSFIAGVMGPHERRQINPNARLIAAAPEMLEALINLYKQIEDSDYWWMQYPERGGFDQEKIEQLIEKVTGLPIEEVLKIQENENHERNNKSYSGT
jgi:hypothetical protein